MEVEIEWLLRSALIEIPLKGVISKEKEDSTSEISNHDLKIY